MPYRTAEPHSWLIAHHVIDPRRQERLPKPVPTRCTARTYGGDIVTIDGAVDFRAEGGKLLAFTADYEGFGEWTAWVRRECCEPLSRRESTAGTGCSTHKADTPLRGRRT
jgi:hypothetical protein